MTYGLKILRLERIIILEKVTSEISLSFIDVFAHHDLDDDIESDHVKRYAVEVLSLGQLYMEFSDSIREADGDRILRCWRYLMLLFKAKKRKNYSIEALNVLAQYHFLLTTEASITAHMITVY